MPHQREDGAPPAGPRLRSASSLTALCRGQAHLFTAVEASLSESIEKHSAALGREALFDKTEQIARLPPYLAVNFVRFQYRKDTEKRAKILRPISFPDVLDVRNLCTKELQANIASHNNRLEEARDKAAADKASADKAAADKAAAAAAPADTEEHTLAGAAALAAKPAEPTPMETEGAGSSGEARNLLGSSRNLLGTF